MKKRLISMIAVIAMAAGLFTSCAGQPDATDVNAQSGKVYALQDFTGSAGQGILAPAVNSKGQLVVASQADDSPVVLTTYDASGQKVSDVTTDVTDAAAYLALDAKDGAYILTASDVHVLDSSGKTTGKIPVGNLVPHSGPVVKASEAASASQQQYSGDFNGNAAKPQQSGTKDQGGNEAASKLIISGITGFAVTSDGSIFLSSLGAGVIQADKNGNKVRSFGREGINLICMNEKEQLMVYSTDQNGNGITTYDTQSGSQVSKLDTSLNNPSMFFYDRHAKRMLFMNGDGVYPVKEDGSMGDVLVTLSNFSLGSTTHSFAGFAMDGEGNLYIASSDSGVSGAYGVSMKAGSANTMAISLPGAKADNISRFALVDASTVPQKKTLTIAGLSDNGAVRAAIDAFQKDHPDYQVTLKTYSNEIAGVKGSDQPVDMTNLIQQFNTDVIANNTADIYILDNLPYYKYLSKGILADLGEMMSADNMDMSQYYGNIFDACRVDGKLYTLPTEFTYTRLVGKAANMPAGETLTIDDFFKAAQALPAGLSALPKEDALQTFENFMKQNYSYFVDQNAKTARFNSTEFIDLLNRFKALVDSKMSGKSPEDQDEYEQVGDGVLAFASVPINGLQIMPMVRALAGDDVKFASMPSMDLASVSFQAAGLYGINASSHNKQMAWEFLKTVLSPDIQGTMQQTNGIPVSKAAVQKMIEQMTDPQKSMQMSVKTSDKQVDIKPLTADEYAAMATDFGKLNKLSAPDQNIVNILNEELPSFFSGQKSAADAASLIQNRVQTILDE